MAAQKLRANREWVRKSTQIRQWIDWLVGRIGRWTEMWLFVIGMAAVFGGLGWLWCLNSQPLIVCSSSTSPCYRLRLWGTKMVSADLAKTQCTKTRQGISCLLPNQAHKKSKK